MTYWYAVDSVNYNGRLDTQGNILSRKGCPYRGSTVCHRCPLAAQIALECEYNCASCLLRGLCKCGHDQTERLLAWGLILL